jgi:hypothetical protein
MSAASGLAAIQRPQPQPEVVDDFDGGGSVPVERGNVPAPPDMLVRDSGQRPTAPMLFADAFRGPKSVAKAVQNRLGVRYNPVPQSTREARAQLARLDNSRIDTRIPASGPYHTTYSPEGVPRHYGTARTVALFQMVAERFHHATGLKLRIGDISVRGGDAISGHRAHTNGRNVDIDMVFNDGRTQVEPRRNSQNATYRSPAYDRERTQLLVNIIRELAPNADILFNDPNIRGVRAYGAHDNHLHIQGLGG